MRCTRSNSTRSAEERNANEAYALTGRRWSAIAAASSNGLASVAEDNVTLFGSPIQRTSSRTRSNPSHSAFELSLPNQSPMPNLQRASSLSAPPPPPPLQPRRSVSPPPRIPPASIFAPPPTPGRTAGPIPQSPALGPRPIDCLSPRVVPLDAAVGGRALDHSELAALKQRFQELDASGRGFLSRSEFYQLFHSIIELPRGVDSSEESPLFDFAYNLFDSAGGEGLDMKEFISGCWILVGSEEERVRHLFHMYDKDNSGTLNIAELQHVFRVIRSYALAREGKDVTDGQSVGLSSHRRCESDHNLLELARGALKEQDQDNDGQIGFEDFQKWCATNPTVKGWMDMLSQDTARGIARLRDERERQLLAKELSEIGLMDAKFWQKSLNVSLLTPDVRPMASTGRSDPQISNDFRLSAPVAGPSHSGTSDHTDQEIMDSMASSRSQLSQNVRESAIGKFEIDFNKLTFERRVGEGSFAEVYSGRWLDSKVAIKVFKSGPRLIMHADGTTAIVPRELGGETLDDISFDPTQDTMDNDETINPSDEEQEEEGRTRFLQEVALLMSLRHPHVLFYIGACVAPQYPLCIVSELIDGQSLFSLLHSRGNKKLSLCQKISLTQDIARGMFYLHSRTPPVLHRDLKSANILVERLKDNELKATIIDFGLSKLSSTEVSRSNANGLCGSLVTMAPEIMARENYKPGSDVYSFGIITWEIFTGRIPFKNMAPAQLVHIVSTQKKRPTYRQSDQVPDGIKQFIDSCWQHDIQKRPDFMIAVRKLNRLRENLLCGRD